MRVLITGAGGLLGRALVEVWGSDEIVPATSKDADIRDNNQVRRLLTSCRPDWTVHTAAYTDVDGCEKNPELTQQVNYCGAINIARATAELGSRLLLISSDYVFDGEKRSPYEVDDPVRPLNAYGRSKADAERGVREVLPGCCILRTSWLFGAEGRCFPKTILLLAKDRKTLPVVSDQRGSPTFNRDLAQVIVRLVRTNATGTIHAANAGDCSWFEFANEIVNTAGLADITILPISTQELKRPAPRPLYSVLSCTGLVQYGISMRTWQEALKAHLHACLPAIPEARRENVPGAAEQIVIRQE